MEPLCANHSLGNNIFLHFLATKQPAHISLEKKNSFLDKWAFAELVNEVYYTGINFLI